MTELTETLELKLVEPNAHKHRKLCETKRDKEQTQNTQPSSSAKSGRKTSQLNRRALGSKLCLLILRRRRPRFPTTVDPLGRSLVASVGELVAVGWVVLLARLKSLGET